MNEKWRFGCKGIFLRLSNTPIRRPSIFALISFVFFSFIIIWSPSTHPEILEDIQIVEKPKEVPQLPFSKPLASLVEKTLKPPIVDDYEVLIDLTKFNFLINHYPCNDSTSFKQVYSTLILVLIHSDPANWVKRQAIRDTWGSWSYFPVEGISLRLLFLLGEVSSKSLQQIIYEENQRTEDIIQGNFLDSYKNLTYKHVMGLKWATYFCPQASYVLKTDDDVFVNIPTFVEFLSDPFHANGVKLFPKRYILCSRQDKAHVKRSYRSKWHVTPQEYPSSVYPSYCSGSMILYSMDVVTQLYQRAQVTPYFWIDDVHVSGTLAAQLNLTQTDIGNLMLTESQALSLSQGRKYQGWLKWWKWWKWNKSIQNKFLFGHELHSGVIRKIWKSVNGISTERQFD